MSDTPKPDDTTQSLVPYQWGQHIKREVRRRTDRLSREAKPSEQSFNALLLVLLVGAGAAGLMIGWLIAG